MNDEEAKKCQEEIKAVLDKYGFVLKIVQNIAIDKAPVNQSPIIEDVNQNPNA